MTKPLRFAILGALTGLATWLVSEPFAHTAAERGVLVGASSFSFGSFYGWFAHATLGATIVGTLAFAFSIERMRLGRACLWGLAGLLVGGLLGWFSDSRSDLLAIRLLRSGAMPRSATTLMWHFAVAMSLSIGIALCAQPTFARVSRILAGGLAAAFASFFARQALAPISLLVALVRGGTSRGWQPYDPDRLADHVVMGLVLGLCVGLGETLLTSARLRLVLGRGEGREYPLASGLNRIGSAEGIEVPLFGIPGVAPVHAQIWPQDGRWILADGGTPEGTQIGGQPITQAWLFGGETIEIGSSRLQFLLKGQVASPYAGASFQTPSPNSAPIAPVASRPTPTLALARHRLIDPFGAVVDLTEGETTVGRDDDARVRLAHDGLVSRRHARVVVSGAEARVEDLGSRNGTAVNGRSIAGSVPLADGDRIRFGATEMTYRAPSGA